ncbi:hypothetical protein [Arcobacter vandammei]|uniref:hypothetical protein n=1 Tax=Arcobacter vandammei TaxID=2782243 RepID=UPI0018DF2E72|nr:hypothetical protein [Arcobacter vandammei]
MNGYHNKNLSEYNELSPSDKEKYKKAEDNLYLKKPNGYDDRLDKFNKLKKHMGL